jgi:hypothetical protein
MAQQLSDTGLIVGKELYDLLHQLAYESRLASLLVDHYAAKLVVTTETANYLDALDDGRIGFMPTSRLERALNEGRDPMTGGGRQSLSAGKALRRIVKPECFLGPLLLPYVRYGVGRVMNFGEAITDADVEKLAVMIQARFRPIHPFIVTGEAIRYWYWENSYTEVETSTLHTSCMRYSNNWHQTRWYARNPRTIGMLCLLAPDNGLAARAILWNGESGIFMDRVYGTNQSRRAFRRFAKERGWFVRENDGPDMGLGGAFFATPVQVPARENNRPYMDTMSTYRYHATGDQEYTLSDRWLSDTYRNPIEYGAVTCGERDMPNDHPLFRGAEYGRESAAKRDLRVDWLSNFDAIPPWPDDLLRTDPRWTIRAHSDPEDDAQNWARLPPRRTEAAVIEKPKPTATNWTVSVNSTSSTDTSEFQAGIQALQDAFVNGFWPPNGPQAGTTLPNNHNPVDDIPF